MCQFKSGIILKDLVFVPDYDSHSDMLEELKIKDTKQNAERLFVRAELIPENDDPFSPIEKWKYRVDQDILPEWYVAEVDEARMREAVKEWAKVHILIGKEIDKINSGAGYCIKDCKIGVVYGSAKIGLVYGRAEIGKVFESATIGKVTGSAEIGEVLGSAKIVYMTGAATIGEVTGSAKIGSVAGSAKICSVAGSAKICSMYGSAKIGSVSGYSIVVGNIQRIGNLEDLAIVIDYDEKKIYHAGNMECEAVKK